MGTSLWNIADELYKLEEHLIETCGELGEKEELFLVELQTLLETKTESCINYIDHVESMIKIAKDKKKEIESYIKASQNRVDKFKEYIISCMDKMGTDKVSSLRKKKLTGH